MSGITAEEQVAKRCYKNQTAGWLGVVKLDHLGAQAGVSIAPYGTIWLTDNEALLTARAPALAKDNPFEEQMFQGYDSAGVVHDMPLRPLILIEDDREIPSGERFVPVGTEVGDAAVAAAQADTATALASNSDRAVATEAAVPVLAPSMAAAVPPSHAMPGAPPTATPPGAEADVEKSWVENPDRVGTPVPGSLGGSNEPAPTADPADPVTTGSPTGAPPQQPAPQAPPQATAPVAGLEGTPPPAAPPQPDVPTQTVVPSESAGTQQAAGSPSEQSAAAPASVVSAPSPAEETAAITPTGEETGAAATPVGEPPKGEFAAKEEVGSPDAPTATPPVPA